MTGSENPSDEEGGDDEPHLFPELGKPSEACPGIDEYLVRAMVAADEAVTGADGESEDSIARLVQDRDRLKRLLTDLRRGLLQPVANFVSQRFGEAVTVAFRAERDGGVSAEEIRQAGEDKEFYDGLAQELNPHVEHSKTIWEAYELRKELAFDSKVGVDSPEVQALDTVIEGLRARWNL